MNISDFKARMLSLAEESQNYGKEFILLKHGKPIVKVVPIAPADGFMELAGSLTGILKINGDIIQSDSSKDWKSMA